MAKTIKSTLEFIDIVDLYLRESYNTLFAQTRDILATSKLDKHDKSHLEWGLAHMHNSMGEFHRDLARHKQTLLDHMAKEFATSTKEQDGG